MSVIEDIRVALTAYLADGLGVQGLPRIPQQPAGNTLFVRPAQARPYLDFHEAASATWGQPQLNLDALLIAPSIDYLRVLPWIDERIELLRELLSKPFEVAGYQRPTLLSVSSPGVLDAGMQLFAVEFQFTPITLRKVGL